MLIAGPQIARLVHRPPRWAHRKISAGDFGEVVRRRGRIREVELAAVADRLGLTFTQTQLAAAGLPIIQTDEVSNNG
jgi:hypothetical protein